jgi:2-C-methyl-D-erythritol 2,4-cyclodiphosphate synthase
MASRISHSLRIGHGYDLHRLEPVAPRGAGKPFILAGVRIDHDKGPVSHSDGDALLHAVTDAILGALCEPDIGQLFPDNAPENDNRNSADFLHEAVQRMRAHGYRLGNLDISVICEKPKVSPHKAAMIANLARLLACDASQINIKGKTHEKVDAVGEGRAIEVHVVALLAHV